MSQNNSFNSNDWESEFDELSRPIPDQVLSVYEVYVKGDSPQDERSNISDMSGVSSGSDQSLVQEFDSTDGIDTNVIKIFGKKIDPQLARNKILSEENNESVPLSEISSNDSTSTRLIDKDDPRSRLHFVKYLKRDGKTLKIWECGICTKEFRHQYTLMRHLPTHTDERNFKCEACGKAFRQLSTLSQHKAIHSDARPYVCEFCKKTFNRVSTLISHRKTHSENKPHKCNVCGKGFHQKGNLRNHIFTHTNERPYKCDLCNKGFNQMSNLVCHKVKSHAHVEKMQYSCGICGKEFPRRFALRSHEEANHGIKYRNSSSSQSRVNQSKKNIRIVELPNANANDNDNNNSNSNSNSNDNDSYSLVDSDDRVNKKVKNITGDATGIDNILVDKIDTKAMDSTIVQGQIPFALYKPSEGIPVLVKVTQAGLNHHMLIPASAEDLRVSGKISPSLNLELDNKSVQVKVPVVATVTQVIDDQGNSTFKVEPPSDCDQDPDEICSTDNLLARLDSQLNKNSVGEYEQYSEPSRSSSINDCNELLELAAQGGIQFVRATEDGRYEVMSNTEARDLMEQNSHDVTILDGAEAEAINIFNARNNITDDDQMIVDDHNDNQIMVLDAGTTQKHILTDDIEIHDDKDIRILESKSFDERFVTDMAYFSGNKFNDFILGNKSMGFDSGISMITTDDDLMASHQDLSNILEHSDMSIPINSQPMLPLLATKNDSMSMFETLSYLKSARGITDDYGALNVDGTCMDNSIDTYDDKFDLSDTSFLSMAQDMKLFNGRINQPTKVALPSFTEMKLLGSKYQEFEAATQLHDIKIFGGYDQYLRPVNGYRPIDHTINNINNIPCVNPINPIPPTATILESIDMRKDIKVHQNQDGSYGNKLLDDLQEEIFIKVPSLFKNPSTSSSTMTPDYPSETRHADKNMPDTFFQASTSFCDSEYLNFEARNVESPNSQTNKVFTLDSLPDLN
ncbi:uncharacterized protein LOC130665024 [Microplitis mediator]|uniref:uncharacterized protein LOC130665024 n=1 Tax=Microplitis mediator TaxID=375433 RepID=UPI0025526375|nr:uncharacterized protein LOC130665024 [Microplitis mediator]